MIDSRESGNAGQEFCEWVSHFQGRLFVILQVYADESGTHDPTGNQQSSEVAVVGGYMAWRDDWKTFCHDWQAVLKSYAVPCFHAKNFNQKSKPYRLWTDDKFNAFKYALAEIAGRNIPLGGAFHIKEQHQAGGNNYPYASTIRFFFRDLRAALNERGFQKEKIHPIFDNNTCKRWGVAIFDEIQNLKNDGFEISEHAFGDDELLLPLQAADMITSVSRQRHFEKLDNQVNVWHKSGHVTNYLVTPNVFEVMLYRNLRPKIGFTPIVTETLGNEIVQLASKFASVRRALSEVPKGYFKPWLNRCK